MFDVSGQIAVITGATVAAAARLHGLIRPARWSTVMFACSRTPAARTAS
jgi:hypothetical protein